MERTSILIVEDEAIVGRHIQRTLEHVGYTVAGIVYTGEEAVLKAAELSPDLILMDISLGGSMDGVQAADLIRERADIPVIYLTAYSDSETLERAKVTSPLGYIVKPFEERELHSTIEMAMYRHSAERRIRESERWLATTLSSIGDAVIATDTDGHVTFMNRVAEWLTGWKQAEALGRDFAEVAVIVRMRTRDPIESPIALTLGQGTITKWMNDRLLISRNGKETPVSDSASPIMDDRGRVSGVVVVLQDVTDRKESEKKIREQYEAIETQAAELEAANAELQETQGRLIDANTELARSEEKFRMIFENANDEIAYLDESGMIIDVNPKVEDIFGWRPEELIGRNFSEFGFVSSEAVRKLRTAFSEAVRMGHEELRSFEARRKDGSGVFIEASTRLIQRENEPRRLLVILRDITERKRAQEQIIQHNRELAALNAIAQTISQSPSLDEILSNALDKTLEILTIENGSVHLMDKEGDALHIGAHRGIGKDEAQAMAITQIGEGHLGIAAQSGEPIFVESLTDSIELVQQGAVRPVKEQGLKSGAFVPLKAKGEVLGVMCAFTQGDRVFTRQEQQLLTTIGHQVSTAIENSQLVEDASRAKALEELERLRHALLASVSHELRTPLTSIKGISSTLVQPDVVWDAETQREFLEMMDREADILHHIVSDLMQMSQMEAGIMQMEKRRSSMAAIVRQVGDQLRALTGKHQFEAHAPDGLPPVGADDVKIGQVLTNLVSNAAAYSDAGTRIVLEVKQVDSDIVVRVTDEGIGIPAEHRGKVFDRFYRLESGVAHRRGGTGLGLSICRGIVEDHDGRIWVESKPGKGSTFSFSIPILGKSETHLKPGVE